MAVINPSPEVDIKYYKQIYPELRNLSDDVAAEHARRFAVEQGRSTCFYDRREHLRNALQEIIDSAPLRALEISPWSDPFLRGANVKYFAVEDSEALRKSAAAVGRNPKTVPEKIHFVSANGDLGVVNETFDIVFSSHVIEHCPDLVTHLHGVGKILDKGGLYVLLVPDKRYCFDHYHAESTISEVIEAFAAKRKIPRLADCINLACTYTHNNPALHWFGIHGDRYGSRKNSFPVDGKFEITGEYFQDDGGQANLQKLSHLVDKYNKAFKEGKYISTHNWRFTPESFGYIIDILAQLGLTGLSRFRICHTLWGRPEFTVMLEKI